MAETQRQQLVAACKGLDAHAEAGNGKRRFAVVTIEKWGIVVLDSQGRVYSAERINGQKWNLDRIKDPQRSELRREIFDSIILTGAEIRQSKTLDPVS